MDPTNIRVCIITITKNEGTLIDYWIKYNSYLFGMQNLILVDNCSDDLETLRVYEKYAGLKIMKLHNYLFQGKVVDQIITTYRNSYDLFIPIDSDQFIVHVDDQGVTSNQKQIVNQLNKLYKKPYDVFHFKYMFNSVFVEDQDKSDSFQNKVPVLESNYFQKNTKGPTQRKSFKFICKSKEFINTHMGLHVCVTKNDTFILAHKLGLLHFAEIGSSHNINRCKIALIGLNYGASQDDDFGLLERLFSLRNYKIKGGHRVKQYKNFLIRKIILDSCIKYFGCLPTKSNLDNFIEPIGEGNKLELTELLNWFDEVSSVFDRTSIILLAGNLMRDYSARSSIFSNPLFSNKRRSLIDFRVDGKFNKGELFREGRLEISEYNNLLYCTPSPAELVEITSLRDRLIELEKK